GERGGQRQVDLRGEDVVAAVVGVAQQVLVAQRPRGRQIGGEAEAVDGRERQGVAGRTVVERQQLHLASGLVQLAQLGRDLVAIAEIVVFHVGLGGGRAAGDGAARRHQDVEQVGRGDG